MDSAVSFIHKIKVYLSHLYWYWTQFTYIFGILQIAIEVKRILMIYYWKKIHQKWIFILFLFIEGDSTWHILEIHRNHEKTRKLRTRPAINPNQCLRFVGRVPSLFRRVQSLLAWNVPRLKLIRTNKKLAYIIKCSATNSESSQKDIKSNN